MAEKENAVEESAANQEEQVKNEEKEGAPEQVDNEGHGDEGTEEAETDTEEEDEGEEEEVEDEEEEEDEDEEVEDEEDDREEHAKKIRRFRKCQRKRKIIRRDIDFDFWNLFLYDLFDSDDGESEEGEGDENVLEVEPSISEYETIYSAVPFEWENEIYEFIDLCDPGTLDHIYTRESVDLSYDIFGQANYLNIVNEMNISPILKFYKSLLTGKIDLSYHGINKKHMHAICNTLELNSIVEYLILKGNPLDNESSRELGNLLGNPNVRITHLDLTGCRIGPEGAKFLSVGLKTNEHLRYLNMTKCYIGDEGMVHLSDLLKNSKLKGLALSWNNLAEQSSEILGTIFATNNNLNDIVLDHNFMHEPSSMKKFWKGLVNNTGIYYLSLKWNALSSVEIGTALSQVLRKNVTMNCLDLSDNRLGGEAVMALKKGLAGNQELEILGLARNPIAAEDLEFLLPGLKAAKKLIFVDLQQIWVSKAFVAGLKKIQSIKPIEVMYEGVYSNYTIVGPDYPAVLMRRAQFEGMKPKRAKRRKEFGHLLFGMGEEPITNKEFMERAAKFKAKINPNIYSELVKQYTTPKGNLVDVAAMRSKYVSIFPNYVPPKPKVRKDKDGKKKGMQKSSAEEEAQEEEGAAPEEEADKTDRGHSKDSGNSKKSNVSSGFGSRDVDNKKTLTQE